MMSATVPPHANVSDRRISLARSPGSGCDRTNAATRKSADSTAAASSENTIAAAAS